MKEEHAREGRGESAVKGRKQMKEKRKRTNRSPQDEAGREMEVMRV